MKHTRKILLGYLVLTGAQFLFTSCVGPDDVGGGGVYYGPDVWFHDDVWLDGGGRGWYGGHHGGYVHPGGGWHHR
jgi:hypothetical protein